MWIDPFWIGFVVGSIVAIALVITIALLAGKRSKQ